MASISNGELGSSVRSKLNNLLALTVNAQTGTSYTILSTDEGKLITFNNSSDITVTIPGNLDVGFYCIIAQLGTGTVTLVASGSTVHSLLGLLSLAGQYAVGSIYCYNTDTFLFSGMVG